MKLFKKIVDSFQARTLKGLERRVIYTAKRSCGEFKSYHDLAYAEADLINAVRDLENYERKIKK
jgi:hypothetical protein